MDRYTRRTVLGGVLGALGSPHLVSARGVQAMLESAAAQKAWVEDRLARLSLDEKVAQIFIFEAVGTELTPDDADRLTALKPGGMILTAPNIDPDAPAAVADLVAAIQATNPALPPLLAVDQEGGMVARLPGDAGPDAVALGQLPDAAVRDASRARATFVRSFGFDVNFAPVADVAYELDSVMAARSFGNDPAVVARTVAAFVAGAAGSGVASCAKHFPGHGRTPVDSHTTVPTVDLSYEEWQETDAVPFRAAVAAGVELVMLGHLAYPQWDDRPMSLSPVAVRVLRQDLGFDGVIVTDDLDMGALVEFDPFDAVAEAVTAGVDLLLTTAAAPSLSEFVADLRRRVETGAVSERRWDTSLRRILRLKARLAAARPIAGTDSQLSASGSRSQGSPHARSARRSAEQTQLDSSVG